MNNPCDCSTGERVAPILQLLDLAGCLEKHSKRLQSLCKEASSDTEVERMDVITCIIELTTRIRDLEAERQGIK
jgi:hypothetical protein